MAVDVESHVKRSKSYLLNIGKCSRSLFHTETGPFDGSTVSCTISRSLNPDSPRGGEVQRPSLRDRPLSPQSGEAGPLSRHLRLIRICVLLFQTISRSDRLGFFCMCSQCIPKAAIYAAGQQDIYIACFPDVPLSLRTF